MDRNELERVLKAEKYTYKIITVDDLRIKKDRTMLYGYTCDRSTFHVYLKDMKIHTVIYNTDYSEDEPKPINMREINVKCNEDFIPDKRLYPAACDCEFSMLLGRVTGRSMPFTSYEERPEAQYYGFIL